MYLAAFLFAGGFMINFENLDKFTFPGVGKYDIPQIEPVKTYPDAAPNRTADQSAEKAEKCL